MSTNIVVFIYDSHMILIHLVCHDDIVSYVITYKMISLINMLIFFSIFGRKVDFVLIRPGKLMSIGIPWMSHETKSTRYIFFWRSNPLGTFFFWKKSTRYIWKMKGRICKWLIKAKWYTHMIWSCVCSSTTNHPKNY